MFRVNTGHGQPLTDTSIPIPQSPSFVGAIFQLALRHRYYGWWCESPMTASSSSTPAATVPTWFLKR